MICECNYHNSVSEAINKECSVLMWMPDRLQFVVPKACVDKLNFVGHPHHRLPNGGVSVCSPNCELSLDGHRDGVAATKTQRSDSAFYVPSFHLIQQRHQDSSAACANRMTERDRAAVDVELR